MMRYLQRRKARIEIVPMIDIMFFLLVFFIMVTLQMIPATGIGIRLPSSRTADKLPSPTLVIALDAAGEITVDHQTLTPEELSSRLHNQGKDARVVIAGAEAAAIGDLVGIMDLCRQAGIGHVGIAARRANP